MFCLKHLDEIKYSKVHPKVLSFDIDDNSLCFGYFNLMFEFEFKGTPVLTIIAGDIKMKNGNIIGDPTGKPLKF